MPIHVNLPSASIAATTTSGRAAYPADQGNKNGVSVVNSGTTVAFVQSGNSAVVATTAGQPVPGGASFTFERNQTDTHLAVIMASGTATVYFSACSAGDR